MADFAKAAKAQDINIVNKFESDLHNLLAILNKSEVVVLPSGTAYKVYKASGTLEDGDVDECEEIPDSGIAMGDASIVELAFSKYRNLVSVEEVAKKGYDIAVSGANASVLRQAEGKTRKSIIDGLALGTGEIEAGTTFQMNIAKAAAYVQEKFEDEAVTPVFFANTQDAYKYLGAANAILAQNFGLSYLENFMGIGNVIIDSNVPEGVIYGTATENLDVVAASCDIPGMELTKDASGIIAVHNGAAYANGALETVLYTGLKVLPIFADRIAVVGEAESE